MHSGMEWSMQWQVQKRKELKLHVAPENSTECFSLERCTHNPPPRLYHQLNLGQPHERSAAQRRGEKAAPEVIIDMQEWIGTLKGRLLLCFPLPLAGSKPFKASKAQASLLDP